MVKSRRKPSEPPPEPTDNQAAGSPAVETGASNQKPTTGLPGLVLIGKVTNRWRRVYPDTGERVGYEVQTDQGPFPMSAFSEKQGELFPDSYPIGHHGQFPVSVSIYTRKDGQVVWRLNLHQPKKGTF